jgi:hypothetical protein
VESIEARALTKRCRNLTAIGGTTVDIKQGRIAGLGFSQGVRQSVLRAGALFGGPQILALDEPTDGPTRKVLGHTEFGRGGYLFSGAHGGSSTSAKRALMARWEPAQPISQSWPS